MRAINLLFILLLSGLLNVGCARPAPSIPSPTSEQPSPYQLSSPTWPGDDWPTAAPQDLGLAPDKLAALRKAVPQYSPNITSLMVIRGGKAALDAYFGRRGPDDPLEVYSVTKSFIATLIGIAIDQGWIAGVDAPVASFFPEQEFANPAPAKGALTLANVLTMSTGLKWSEDDINALSSSPDWAMFMLDRPMLEPPGSRFNYCTGCSHLLSVILQKATGMDALSFARQYLFEPIGIRQATWLTDSQGQPIGGWGLQITPHDMARLGYLYLRQGNWDGRQVVSAAWVKTATAAHIEVGDNPKLRYGYHWWVRSSINGYAALGRGGQMIAVIPAHDLVVVFTANGVDHEVEFRLIEDYLLPAVK